VGLAGRERVQPAARPVVELERAVRARDHLVVRVELRLVEGAVLQEDDGLAHLPPLM
jgi:hypothetical protein